MVHVIAPSDSKLYASSQPLMKALTTLLCFSCLTLFGSCGGSPSETKDAVASDTNPVLDALEDNGPELPLDVIAEPDGASDSQDTDSVDAPDTSDVPLDEGPPKWIAPEGCENLAEESPDPLTLLHEVDVKAHPLGHYQSQMVDIERDPEQDRIYAVGWGGFYVFNEFDWGIQLAGRHNGQGNGLGQFYRLEVLEESVVAVTNRDYGLAFIPASDPANLYMSWVFNVNSGSGMAQVDDYLHVVTHTGDIHSFDVSQPTVPNKLGKISGLGNAWDIVVKGNKGYVADNTLGVVVVDFSDPAWPVVAESFEAVSGVQDLAIQYNVLYVAVGSHGVQMFDISDPSEPSSLGVISYPKPVNSVSTAGKFLWGSTYDEIFVVDILGGFEPYPLAHRPSSQWAMHVDAVGTKAYIADWGKLQAYNIDASQYGPDLRLDKERIFYWQKPARIDLEMSNIGTADLDIHGASIDDARFTLTLEESKIPPGETRILRIDFEDDGEAVDSTLCISTNDADLPVQSIPLLTALKDVAIPLGSQAPDFTLSDTDGQSVTLSEHTGKSVLLTFFSPQDPRAPSHFSDVQASIRAKYPDEKLVVWGIASEGTLSSLNKFKEDMGLTFPILLDESGEVTATFAQPDHFEGASYPKDWVISKTGQVIYTNNKYNPVAIKSSVQQDLQE